MVRIMARVGDRWDGAPPEEAYGRVSHPERFAGLHVLARELLDELESRFAVHRSESAEADYQGSEPVPAVQLVPADPAAAPLTVVFTTFPGLIVHLGGSEWLRLPFCGCDACDETVEECARQLRGRIDALTAGAFGERLVQEQDGGWRHERWYRTASGEAGSSRSTVTGERLRELRAELPGGERAWAPWSAHPAVARN